jgi:hypothetical protein
VTTQGTDTRIARNVAMTEFFNLLTGLIKLCEPLIKQAVEDAAKKGK